MVHNGEDIQGFLGYCFGDNLFEPEEEIEVLFMYVLPQYRGGEILNELLGHLDEKGYPITLTLKDDQHRASIAKWGYHPEVILYRRDCE